eukprot:12750389-Alexandrium_andersonii.AAC.1
MECTELWNSNQAGNHCSLSLSPKQVGNLGSKPRHWERMLQAPAHQAHCRLCVASHEDQPLRDVQLVRATYDSVGHHDAHMLKG